MNLKEIHDKLMKDAEHGVPHSLCFSTDFLDALVEKGCITRERADEILTEAEANRDKS